MDLSVNIIFAELKERFAQASLYKKNKGDYDLCLQPPQLYDKGVTFQPGQIYVVSEEQLPSDCTCSGLCLLITPSPIQVKFSYGANISVIEVPDADLITLFNQILTVFHRYEEWDTRLRNMVFGNAPLEEYLTCSYPIIGNSMSIHNNNFLYLARFDGDPGQKTFLQKRELFDPDFLLRVDEQSDQPIFYSRNVIRYKSPDSTDEYFFLNLFNGNTAAGRLVVANSQRHFAPQDSALIQHLGKYLEAALSYAAFTGSGKNLRRDALLDYLSGKNHSDDKIMHLKTISPFSKLKNGQHLYCIVGRENSDLPEQYIAYQLEHALPESVCVLFDSHIVFLCANEYGQAPEELFRKIEELTQQYSITAGCSNPFTDFFDLKYCYQEAIFTLRFNGADDTGLLYHFRDCTLEYFLHYGYSALPIRLLCAECIIALMEHDKRNTTVSYCDSLRTYLDTGMNSAETARILNITRNTFLSRLERIMRFIDLDLENEDNKLYLQISLRLIKTQNFLSPSFD